MTYKKPTPKTQKEISRELHKDTYLQQGNPNDLNTTNRGNENSWRGDDTKPFYIGIQNIDEAIIYHIKNEIKPFVIQNGERIEVPVIYGSPERWKSVQKDGYYKDSNGAIMLPLMIIKRDTIDKIRDISNKIDANNPNNYEYFEKKYSSRNAYSQFNILNEIKPQKELYNVVIPDYVRIGYSCIISTYYIDQLNKIIEAVNYASDSYWGNPESFKFKVKIDSISTPVELVQDNNRLIKSTFSLSVQGYLIPNTIQKDKNSINKSFNKIKTIFTTEVVSNIS
jgi:hypothetical protein